MSITIIDIYEDILSGKIEKFPMGTWNYKSDATRVVKYLIEEKLKWSDEEVKQNMQQKVFKKWKLDGMSTIVYSSSPFAALDDAYPGRFKPWELSQAPLGTWTEETMVDAVKWLIEEKLQWGDKEIIDGFNPNLLKEHGLAGMLTKVSSKSRIYLLLNHAYPNRFKPWQLYTPASFWTKETSTLATKWLVEEKLNKDIGDITYKDFADNGMATMLSKIYGNSASRALHEVYPDAGVVYTPIGFWTFEQSLISFKNWIEVEKKWSDEDIKNKFNFSFLSDHGFSTPLQKHFGHNAHTMLDALYPGRFKPWELYASTVKWTPALYKEAIQWLFEEKLKWSDEDIRENVSEELLKKYMLLNPTAMYYNDSIWKTIMDAFPNRFKREDFKYLRKNATYTDTDVKRIYEDILNGRVKMFPQGFWKVKQHAIVIMKYIFDEKLMWSVDDIKLKFKSQLLLDLKLKGMLTTLYGGSAKRALEEVYPGIYDK